MRSCHSGPSIYPVNRVFLKIRLDLSPEQAMKIQFSHDTLYDINQRIAGELLLERVERKWQDFLAENRPAEEAYLFYLHEKNGRPLAARISL